MHEQSSLLKIFAILIRSIIVGSFFGMSIGYPIIGTIGSPIGIIYALTIVAPLLPIIFALCVYLDRKGSRKKRQFLVTGTTFGLIYGLLLDYLSNFVVKDLEAATEGNTLNILELASLLSILNFFPYHFVLVLTLSAFFTSWFYWRRMYSDKKNSRLF